MVQSRDQSIHGTLDLTLRLHRNPKKPGAELQGQALSLKSGHLALVPLVPLAGHQQLDRDVLCVCPGPVFAGLFEAGPIGDAVENQARRRVPGDRSESLLPGSVPLDVGLARTVKRKDACNL